MRIDVALLPGQRFDASGSVCIVVDVLRASSSIVTLLNGGCESVVAAADVAEARRLGELLPHHILCGEQGGLPPERFEYGNSPAEFSKLGLAGGSVILATSNGTRVLAALAAEAPVVLVGCLLNRTAVAEAALAIAEECDLDIAVVCSAAYGGSVFVLEDALGAGAIADAALRASPDLIAADAARFAADAFSVANQDIGAAVRSAYHAGELLEIGLAEDVAYCARVDVSRVAPVLERGEEGTLALRSYS